MTPPLRRNFASEMIQLKSKTIPPLLTIAALALAAHSANASITFVNDGSFGGTAAAAATGTYSQNISVGNGADMLVVMTSSELGAFGVSGNDGTGTGDPFSITYGGVSMTLAVGNIDHQGIWYIDLSNPSISGTQLNVSMLGYGTRNGFAAGWVTLNGNLQAGEFIDVHNTATVGAGQNSISLNTTVDQTFNVVSFNANSTGGWIGGSPNNTSNFIPVDNNNDNDGSELIYADTDIGSAASAAGWEEGTSAGSYNYSYTLVDPGTNDANYRRIDAVAFAVVPEPDSAALIGAFGVLALFRRRRGS